MSDELRKIADAHTHPHPQLADAVESIGSALTDLADWFRTEYAGLPQSAGDARTDCPTCGLPQWGREHDHSADDPEDSERCGWSQEGRGRCLLTVDHAGGHEPPGPAEVGAYCSANAGGDPAAGCDELATGPDGLCTAHRQAAAKIEAYDGDGAVPAPVDDDPNWVPHPDHRHVYTKDEQHPDHPHTDSIFDDWQLAQDGHGVFRYPVGGPPSRRWYGLGLADPIGMTDADLFRTGPRECVIVPLPADHHRVVINRSTGTVRVRGGGVEFGLGTVARLAGELIRAGRELQTAPGRMDDGAGSSFD